MLSLSSLPINICQSLPWCNIVGLLLQILEPLFTRGSVVVLDSGFCVLKGIIELKKRGVYASALIKSVTTGKSTLRVMT